MKKIILALVLFLSFELCGQDTMRIMHYNLLNYGNFTDYCTINNNNPDEKNIWLKIIIDYTLPDIFTVNEISNNPYYHQLLLDEVLNTGGRDYYEKAEPTNLANSDIINMLFYNSGKVGLAGQDVIETSIRDINVYRLFYRYPDLQITQDTIFLYCIVAHLKAGTSSSDKAQRAAMAEQIMDYLTNNQIENYCMLMGDLNLQNSNEQAWQLLTNYYNPMYDFSDPVQMPGNWHANPAFASVHTQSTHLNSNGCAAGGGMDDRFDFILLGNKFSTLAGKMNYIEGSYEIPGQDGLHFDSSIIDPPNYSAPEEVISALYEISDHLPVITGLKVIPGSAQFCAQLFFSEYVEGTNNNKALEIYNPTDNIIDLSGYRLARYANGSTEADWINLGGTLDPKKTYVVVVDKRDPNGTGYNTPVDSALQALADTFLCPDYSVNKTMYFNGNDAMALQKSNGELLDLIGKIGENPGAGWTDDSLCVAGPFTDACGAVPWTQNHTLVRKFNVRGGLSYNPEFFNVALEWDTLPVNTFDSLGFHRCSCNSGLPQSWEVVPTMISHIITIPLSVAPLLNEQPLNPGDYIGVFYKTGLIEKCGGFAEWTTQENIAVVAYGDDELTPEKDGFTEDENFIWKVFSTQDYLSFYADVEYDPFLPDTIGKFVTFGLSALIKLKAFSLETQNILLSQGWSGISSCLIPKWKNIEEMFSDISNELIILNNDEKIYFPEQGINTLIDWETHSAYQIKLNAAVTFIIEGIPETDKTITLKQGWNFFPVISSVPVSCESISSNLSQQLILIKEIAGYKVFWPEKNISSLTELLPGKGYFLKVNNACQFTFE